jgi:hypothetical protein
MKTVSVEDLRTIADEAWSRTIKHDKRYYEATLVPDGIRVIVADRTLPKRIEYNKQLNWTEVSEKLTGSFVKKIFDDMDAWLDRALKEATI